MYKIHYEDIKNDLKPIVTEKIGFQAEIIRICCIVRFKTLGIFLFKRLSK